MQTYRVVIDLDRQGIKFYDDYIVPIANDIGDDESLSRSKANFCEIVRQIFDVIEPNIVSFMHKVEWVPVWQNLMIPKELVQDITFERAFKTGIKELAFGIFSSLTRYGYLQFFAESDVVLEFVDRDCVQLYIVPKG